MKPTNKSLTRHDPKSSCCDSYFTFCVSPVSYYLGRISPR